MSKTIALISHRGNLTGPNPQKENTPDYIGQALHQGFHVEVDVWGVEGQLQLYLGHDGPMYPVPFNFIRDRIESLWVHCKNIYALALMRAFLPEARYFFHQTDDYAITSWHDIWCYPGKEPYAPHAVIVMPETWTVLEDLPSFCLSTNVRGICSDLIAEIKRSINKGTTA